MEINRNNIVENKNRKEVEKYLATHRKASINQISKDLDISWATAKKHLEYLEAIGRVHKEELGNSIIYFFNGFDKWQKQIRLNPSHVLFLDTFISPFREPFIRIKEVKKEGEKWKHVGDIMITRDKLKNVINFLKKVEANIDEY